jgi:hypothetical protein
VSRCLRRSPKILIQESLVMKRVLGLFLMLAAASHVMCVEPQDEDVDIDSIARAALASYQSGASKKSSKSSVPMGLPAQVYASIYFYDPYVKPLTTFPTIRRLAQWSADAELAFDTAVNSYGSSGSRENLASAVFGKNDIKVQDLALVTRLAAKGAILAALGGVPNHDDFARIAGEPVQFDAFRHREQVQIGVSVAFLEKQLRLSCGIPVAMGSNQLRIANDGPLFKKVFERTAFPLAGDFKNHTLSGFIDALVRDMGMKPAEQITQYGLGQAFVGAVYQPSLEQVEHAQFGVQLHLPTATAPDINRVWPVDLGVNNFAIAANAMMLFAHNRYFNPYMQVDGRFNFSSKATRRVPRLVSKGGAAHPQEKMALGNWVTFGAGDFNNEIEATVRGFSDFATDINWQLGHSVMLQVGNIFKKIIGRGGFLDLAYCLRVKFKDAVTSIENYYTDPLVANTDEIGHELKLGYSYHFTDAFTLSVQGTGTFAGKNVPQNFGGMALLSFSF